MRDAAAEMQAGGPGLAELATALLHALARDEAAGRRPHRLTEPGQATWQRFRGRLSSGDLLRLLAEDGAVAHPVPFASARLGSALSLDGIDDAVVDRFLADLPSIDLAEPAAAYREGRARRRGVPTRPARSELHQWAAERGPGFFLKPDPTVLPALGTVSQPVVNRPALRRSGGEHLPPSRRLLSRRPRTRAHGRHHEKAAPLAKKIKSPTACIALCIKCMTPYEMLRLERARFILGPKA